MSDRGTAISALLPVKNGALYLETLLPSILEMLEPSDELIVINDGSTDATEAIVTDFGRTDSRLRFVSTTGIGLVKSLNLGVSLSSNDWIARFDADDSYSKLRLQMQRDLLMSDVAVVFSDYRLVSASGIRIGTIPSPVFSIPTAVSLIASQRTAHPSAVINRKMLLQAEGYLVDDFPAEDLGLWLRLTNRGKLLSSPQTLLDYRLSKNSVSANNRRSQLAKTRQLLGDYANWPDLYTQAQLEFLEVVRAYLLLPRGAERVILHVRELKMIEKIIYSRSTYLPRLLSIGLWPTISVVLAGVRLLMFSFFRRVYRKF